MMNKGIWLLVLMIGVASVQIYLRNRKPALSTWKGGGFGMFSTIKSPSSRILKVWGTTAEGKHYITVPKEMKKLKGKIRTYPNEKLCLALLEGLREKNWRFINLKKMGAIEDLVEPNQSLQMDDLPFDRVVLGNLVEAKEGESHIELDAIHLSVEEINLNKEGNLFKTPVIELRL